MRVLIVEDYADTAEALRVAVQQWGHETAVALTGGSALEQLRKFKPDAVLLDLALPDTSGWEVAAKVEREGALRRPILVVVSAFNADPDRSRAAGVDGYFTKPPDLDALRDMLGAFAKQLDA